MGTSWGRSGLALFSSYYLVLVGAAALLMGCEVGRTDIATVEDRVRLDVQLSGLEWGQRRCLCAEMTWQSSRFTYEVQHDEVWVLGRESFRSPLLQLSSRRVGDSFPVGLVVRDCAEFEWDWNQEFAYLLLDPAKGGQEAASFWGSRSDIAQAGAAQLLAEFLAVDLYGPGPTLPGAQYRLRRMHVIASELARRNEVNAIAEIRERHAELELGLPLIDVLVSRNLPRPLLTLLDGDGQVLSHYAFSCERSLTPVTVVLQNTADVPILLATPPQLGDQSITSLAFLVRRAQVDSSAGLSEDLWDLVHCLEQQEKQVYPATS